MIEHFDFQKNAQKISHLSIIFRFQVISTYPGRRCIQGVYIHVCIYMHNNYYNELQGFDTVYLLGNGDEIGGDR